MTALPHLTPRLSLFAALAVCGCGLDLRGNGPEPNDAPPPGGGGGADAAGPGGPGPNASDAGLSNGDALPATDAPPPPDASADSATTADAATCTPTALACTTPADCPHDTKCCFSASGGQLVAACADECSDEHQKACATTNDCEDNAICAPRACACGITVLACAPIPGACI